LILLECNCQKGKEATGRRINEEEGEGRATEKMEGGGGSRKKSRSMGKIKTGGAFCQYRDE